MNYIIHTPSAVRLKKEILESVSNNRDARSISDRLPLDSVAFTKRSDYKEPEGRKNGKDIVTWKCVETEGNEKVLVHTTEQWEEKGCITLKHNTSHNELKVRFHYWDTCEDRSNDDDKYMLGRFTELILVHFSYYIDKVVIE